MLPILEPPRNTIAATAYGRCVRCGLLPYARRLTLVPDDDLAEMCPAFQVRERLLQRLERKRPIDHRLHLVLVDRAQHRLEAVAVTDGDALQPHLARDHQPERRSERAARQDADHR